MTSLLQLLLCRSSIPEYSIPVTKRSDHKNQCIAECHLCSQ